MPHSLIRLAAIALTVLLVLFSLAFAYAASQREQRLAAQAASAPPASPASSAFDPQAAAASFEARCIKCHEMDEMTDWLKPTPAPERLGAMKAFLESHRKAPPADNEVIATYLAGVVKD